VFGHIFRSHDLGGFAKALWVIFVIVVPYLGVFVYLIARGHKMSEHAAQARTRRSAHTSKAQWADHRRALPMR
jgi:ABC-type Fe3+ transport system permease subunit